ncbi:MAG: ribonucleoside-triphosphate reductase, adenosylcobalamin-dependent [Cyanothece sp. SIO1E1]|nr:ribonucleoside-triphosphate reductase, adenosylcobalamin-dependent [Cyanothece sp. SIO1E1]
MVQELERTRLQSTFPATAPAANPVFYRTYSRRGETVDGRRETWTEVCDRTLRSLTQLGGLSLEEAELLSRMQRQLKALPSGRWLWVGGTDWIENPDNFSGAYNCTSTNVTDWPAFGLMMDLAMMGCGTGAVLEPKYINQLPVIGNRLNVTMAGEIGVTPAAQRREHTEVQIRGNEVYINVGDSRQGWVSSYQSLLELSTDKRFSGNVEVVINLSDVRPAGEKLRGFGGVANPIRLPGLYERCASILNKALGRQLNSVECCLLIDEAAACVVAGNIRRCLPEDALVHTVKGLVPIRDIKVGDQVQTPLGFRQVVATFDQGQQEVYEIETNSVPLRSTLNHRHAFLINAQGGFDWKYANALKAGDRLMHNRQILPGHITHLPPDFTANRPQQSHTAKPLTIPELTSEIAWLIGFTHGDGYVALGRNHLDKPYGRVEWAMNRLDQVTCTRIQQKLDTSLAQFGLTAHHGQVHGENTAKSICSCIRLAEYFHRYIKQPRRPLVVPDFVLQGTIEIRAAYLAGLMDSDGGVHNRPPHLVTSVYRDFVRQVSAVLSSLGIAGRLTIVRPQEQNWQVKYNLTIPALKGRYNSLIASHSAKAELRQGLKMYGFTVPGSMMRESYTYSEMREMGFEGNRATDANYERYIAESEIDIDIPVTVKGIGSYDSVQTYDIEVEEAHCFYCNGYLTHNSAGMRQFTSEDQLAVGAKENLWQQDENGNWRIDPERDALRMANHTRVFHQKPTLEECVESIRKQFYSGEGAIQWAGEAKRRAGAEDRYGLNPCGEILGSNFHCNLAEIHLNQIDPNDLQDQEDAFTAGALAVAALLNHQFVEPRYQQSRQEDPIVGVSFTGLFDFFVKAFGVDWLRWWAEGRPDTITGLQFKQREAEYLSRWQEIVHRVVWEYCDRHHLKRPNRCTTVQPAGTKSLLTGASPGWHPPKAQRFIRRITFRKNDPVALACLDFGYPIVPSQSDKDDNGQLLNDPFDPRCTEWLVEIPVAVSWANLPGADEIEIEKFSAIAQFDFYMQVQRHYTAHNTSATLELREDEIEPLAERVHQAIAQDEGYISAALLARFDAPFPRLPFEKINQATYESLQKAVQARCVTDDFYTALTRHDSGELSVEGPAGCDSDKCMLPEQK